MNKSALLVLISELGPVMAFFVAGRLFDFFTAVAIFMVITIFATLLSWFLERRIPVVPIVSAVFILVGGAITLLYEKPDAIIFADTLYYFAISCFLFGSLYMGRLIFKTLFNSVFAITDEGWRLLTWRWAVFLLLAGVVNEVVRLTASPEFWIDYRFYKTMIVLTFSSYQFTLSRRYRIESEANTWGLRTKPNPLQ